VTADHYKVIVVCANSENRLPETKQQTCQAVRQKYWHGQVQPQR